MFYTDDEIYGNIIYFLLLGNWYTTASELGYEIKFFYRLYHELFHIYNFIHLSSDIRLKMKTREMKKNYVEYFLNSKLVFMTFYNVLTMIYIETIPYEYLSLRTTVFKTVLHILINPYLFNYHFYKNDIEN